jgi:hypothetical protein
VYATTFSKNRRRLLDHEIADRVFASVVAQAKLRHCVSSDYFSVDGTLLEAWASHKSFQPKDGPRSPMPLGRNTEVSFQGGAPLESDARVDDRRRSADGSQVQRDRSEALRCGPVFGVAVRFR